MLGVLDNLIIRQMLKGFFPSQTHYLPERHGERPYTTRTCIPVLKFRYYIIAIVFLHVTDCEFKILVIRR